eukprot:TRINITY_DN1087_c0_g1_i1.p1 TRINITY_DN1087_c0_g1~~TRINITY_DN1087_c0_g1_i1.p1  ORF type:complete len:219 (+),score=32.34 TRINITY_DN1087_c0_g1_i1:103-759(+)
MAELAWLISRDTSKFLVKRGGIKLSKDPFNLSNNHTFTSSGLYHEKAIAIKPPKSSTKAHAKLWRKESVRPRRAKGIVNPSLKKRVIRKQDLGTHYRAGISKVRRTVNSFLTNLGQIRLALKRYNRVMAVQKRTKTVRRNKKGAVYIPNPPPTRANAARSARRHAAHLWKAYVEKQKRNKKKAKADHTYVPHRRERAVRKRIALKKAKAAKKEQKPKA